MLNILVILVLISSTLLADNKKELLFYVGITMVKPINELAKKFEKENDCKIKILQGGSKDLYFSIKSSKVGDLYLPGSVSYRKKYLKDGLLLEGKFVGYNKLALIVKKGNPKQIKAQLSELKNDKLSVVLGNNQSSSVGKASKNVLEKFNLYKESILNTIYLASDSRTLTQTIVSNEADLILNWYATSLWEDNIKYIDALELDDKYSNKSKLVLNFLKTSKNPGLTKKFMEYASSQEGRKVFQKYGFLSKKDLETFDKVVF